MRVFFGLDPDNRCKRAISDWRDRFGRADGRPVPAGNFHITLAFVGEIDAGPLERLCLAVDETIEKERPGAGSLTLDQVGFWPRPRIFWLGSGDVPEHASQLARMLVERTVAAGGRREARQWVPHVTLYRQCREPPPAPVQAPAIPFTFETFTLFESSRVRGGVRYTPLAEWSLGDDH